MLSFAASPGSAGTPKRKRGVGGPSHQDGCNGLTDWHVVYVAARGGYLAVVRCRCKAIVYRAKVLDKTVADAEARGRYLMAKLAANLS